jgi:hypothetical protein
MTLDSFKKRYPSENKDKGFEAEIVRPSMARAPRKKPKKNVLKSGYARAGMDYEVYKPTKD